MIAVYKCRLCGAVFNYNATTTAKIAEACLVQLHVNVKGVIPNAPNLTETHHCGGGHEGDLGLADFQGWEKEANE